MGVMDRYNERKKKTEEGTEESSASSGGVMQRYETRKYYSSLPTESVDENYINTFVSDANKFLGTTKLDNSSYGTWKDLSTRADTISGWLYKNNGSINAEVYNSIADAINKFNTATKDFTQFKTEDDYIRNRIGWLNDEAKTDQETAAARQTYSDSQSSRVSEIDESLPWYAKSWVPNFVENWFLTEEQESLRDEAERLEAENTIYKREQGKLDSYYIPETDEFKQVASNRNFVNPTREELSAYDSSISQGSVALNSGGYFDDEGNIRDKDGNIVQYAESPIADKLGLYHSATDTDIADAYNLVTGAMGAYSTTWAETIVEGDQNEWRELTDYEIDLYYYYLNTEGKEKAFKFLDDLAPTLTKRATQKRTEAINNTGGFGQVALNIASVPSNIFGGAIAFADDVANLLGGNEVNPYSRAHMLSNVATDIRTKTAADLDAWTGGASIPWLDFSLGDAYQAGMSGIDSLVGAYLLGGTGYGVLMGMGAASNEMKALYEKGASTEQMLIGGVLAGAAEMVFEKYSIDKFLEAGDAKSIKDIVVNILKQGGVEASEEAFTEIANTITDVIVMGSQSDWVDAETFIKNVVNAGVGGFISGGGMGGVGSTVSYAQYQNQVNKYGQSIIDKGGVDSLRAQASEMSDNKAISRLAGKVAKNTTARNVGRLATTIQNVTNAKDRSSIATDLKSKGLTKKEAQKVADFTVKVSQGYNPTSEEITEIEQITDKLPDVADALADDVSDTDVVEAEAEGSQGVESPALATQASAQQAEKVDVTENVSTDENAAEGKISGSVEGAERAPSESAVTLESASEKYGAQAQAMIHTYAEGQDVEEYDNAYNIAYNMGMSGVSLSYAMNSKGTAYLSEKQRELAYEAGRAAAESNARDQDTKNKNGANGNTGRRRGVVRGEGVTIADLKKAFSDTQNTAYKLLCFYAEATGIEIVLYKSEAGADGRFIGSQGKFKWSEDTIYIDVNAGLANIKDVNELAKYAMLRTFSHEFTHFIEKWNPIWYNEFRKAVFDELSARGEDVDDLIIAKQNLDGDKPLSYEKASREVVAEAMTDILPDANFVETLVTKHKNIFEALLQKLKEFLADLKAYFNTLGHNPSREANALKEQIDGAVRYVDSIVKLFDKVALEAVENYQATVATETENNNNTYGGVVHEAERAEQTVERRSNQTIAKGNDGSPQKERDGREISKEVRQQSEDAKRDDSASSERHRELNHTDTAFSKDAYITPRKGSVEETEGKILDEYGVEWHLINKEKWDRIYIAFAKAGVVYLREALPEKFRGAVARHEATHIMKHLKYQPYLDFIERTPKMLNMSASGVMDLITTIAERRDIDLLNIDEQSCQTIYDEINATIYGQVNISEKKEAYLEFINEVFYDYDRYIKELDAIHDQFKRENAPKKSESITTEQETHTETAPAETNDYGNFTITDNAEYGTLEIKFDGKPSEAVRDVLKENKFRWHKVKGVWYGKGERTDIVKALRDAYTEEENTATNIIEEEKPNVEAENADNERPILEPDTDRQGAPRSLDEQQADDVRGASSERDSVGDTRQRESQTRRDGDRADTADRLGRSDGNSESGDSRELTEKETQAKAEELAETVEREIEQKSTENPKGNNFIIGDSLHLPDGEKARYRANVDAIRLIKQLESEGRRATVAEQEILSKYVGWGGLPNAFGEYRYNRDTRRSEMTAKDGWEKEFAELRSLVDEGIITEQEYKDMSASTKNAHYTSIEVIKAMYDGLASLGFIGGRMLEPSSGVGNFVGAMPVEMSAKVNSWTMVELDRITGLIAKYLYPNADVRIQGFETANIPDNYIDVAIDNVPFGNFGVVDRSYPKRITKSIHNYFFAKSIDKVRPGGIVMFITSSFTMDSNDNGVRQYIMDRADLLGAIRLPNTAFKGNAGTEVVTDILVLKKREDGTEYAGEDFLEAEYDYNYHTYISNYFKNHPEMVLGKPAVKRGMYNASSLTYDPLTDKVTIDEQIREAFKNIKGKMDYPTKPSPEKTNFAVEKESKKTKSGGFVVHSDGSISRNENGQLVKYDTDEKTAKRIAGILSIRDAYRTLANYLQQGVETKYIKKARAELNKAYDAFVKEYGYLNSPANKKAIEGDPDRYSILSLENYDAQKKTAKKADIFTKDTISANKTVNHVDSVTEGVIASINLTGGVDVSLISKLTDKGADAVTREIIDSRLAFKTRDGSLVAREAYLSGNVRAKLREAEALAPYDSDFNNNVEELRKVIPADIPYNEIYITPGATFIPNEIYADFIAHMLGGRNNQSYGSPDVEVGRTSSGEFKIVVNNKRLKGSYYNNQTWGTARKSFLELIDAMMSSRTVKVNDIIENGDGKKIAVVNEAETEAANEKVKAIQKEFEDWIWKDEDRRILLARLYNEIFNALVNPKYDGSHLSVNGINADYSLRPHQADAVHRIIASGGNTLLAHRVGAGKTLEMAAAAMKMRELGVIKKPVFVVPKSVVAQWGVEFHNYFPAARLLVADDKSFTPSNRKVFTNRIANGDYDAIILSYEQFEKIPMSVEYQQSFYEEQINEIIAAIAEEKAESRDGKGLTVKEMEKKKAQLEKKLKELTSKPKDEDNVDFEMLGIDSLFVDEAHNFKNLEYVSKMTNVAGLGSTKGAQRSFDLYTKIRYLQGLNGGRGIVFATATPVMNSMVELYIMQRYLQPDVLDQLGLKTFDAWAKQFGEVVNKWEINPSGTGMRQKQVFANFRNLNELQLLFRSFADVLTDVPGLKIPKMKGGAVKIVECEPGEFQKEFMQELQKRAENVKDVDPSVDNMLKITSDGRKVSYTQRMIDPTLPYEPECKIFKAAGNIVKEYNDSADIKGTQIVFLDMATPKGTDKSKADTNTEVNADDGYDEESARLYDDMRDYLVKKGIPKREIAFIHEADSDAKRKQLFEDVNNGKVRVLIGSTGKMGVGMNAQKRVVAIHHLDAPWRPGDVEQRDGRAFRQKNINDEVSKYVYVTKGSFDSRLWDILDRKQHFINQIMNGEDVGRTAEDTGEVTLSAAEVKALASGNPLIEEQTKLTDAIKKLENLQKAYNSSIVLARTKLSDDETKIANYTSRISRIREDIKVRVDTYSEGKFSMTVGKQTFTDKKEAGAALAAAIVANANADSYVTVGSFAGFELRVIKNGAEYNGLIHGKEGYKFNVYLNNTTRMANHIGEIIAGFENIIKNAEQMIAELSADRDAQRDILTKPFEKQDELNQKRARFNEVMELLAPKTEEQLGKMDEDTVQEQSRDYLDYTVQESHSQAALEKFGTTTDYEIAGFVLEDGKMIKLGVKGIGVNHSKIEQVFDDRKGSDAINSFIQEGNVRIKASSPGIEISADAPLTVSQFNTLSRFMSSSLRGRGYFYLDITDADGNEIGTKTYYDDSTAEDIKYDIKKYYRDGTIPKDDIYFQQRTDTLTDREVLELAANEIKVSDLTDAENDALTIFRDRLSKLKDLQSERAEQGKLYKEQQFGEKVDRKAAEETLNRMHVLDGQIKKATAEVLTVEEKEVLKRVLSKARKVVEAQEREHGREILNRWRDRRDNAAAIKKYRDRLRADVSELSEWILHPDNKDTVKHIPDVLKNSVIPFLTSIDFTSKRALKGGEATKADAAFVDRLKKLNAAIKSNIDAHGLYSGYNDLPPSFMENLQKFIDSAEELIKSNSGDFVINKMTSEELRDLSQIVRTLKKYITQINRFHYNAMYEHVYEAGENSIEHLLELGNAENTGAVSNFLLWQQMRPAYAFERFGDGGVAIYDGLRRGQAQLAFNTKEIQAFTEQAYTEKEVKAWEDEIKTFNLGNDVVKMPVSYIMAFYELSRDPEALVHIRGEGIRVATYTHKGKKISDVGHILTEGEFNEIIGSLTERQKEVADALQKYMAEQGGKWGNFVSVARFGEEMFTNKNYFPINSDGRHLQANTDEHPSAASLYALLNMSFTKSRQEGANNRIVIYSIFDVFANHMASMAQYNAMALPVLDAIKWFNYKQVFVDDDGNKTVGDSVREQMDRAYGVPEETRPGRGKNGYAQDFVMNIIKAFNGTEAQGSQFDSLALKSLHLYNIAQIAYNLRVVMQQPLAITRAGMLIDYSSIIRGTKLSPSAINKNIEEMQKHSGIAAWKSLGFYDVNISRGLAQIIKHDSSVMDKISDVGMWGAEKADLLTWAAIWSACKEEVIKKQHLSPSSDGFFEAVTKLFEDVIYKTQVVDSILTKNEFMRDKGTFARLVGSFMSEPTTNASMLIDAYDKYARDIQRGMTRQQAWKKNGAMIGRRLYVYAVGAVLLAAIQAVADAWRDDDDYEEWGEKWLDAFGGNLIDELMPFNKLPIMSDLYDLAKDLLSIFGADTYGNPPQFVLFQWWDSLIKGTEILYQKISGEDTNYTWYGGIYKLLQAASGISGLPLGSVTREIVTAWNNTVGAMAPSLKIKDYEPKEITQIRYAYEDGYLTAEEATAQLLEQGLVDNENEAYFTIQGWNAGDGYSKYDKIYDAVRNGASIDETMAELTSHGYTEEDALSQVKSEIGKWYRGGEISKQQATSMLTKYSDMTNEEISAIVNKWSCEVVTGIKYDEIADKYKNGEITASRAIDMYTRYGSMTREKATEKVTVLEFVKQNPSTEGISYAAIKGYNTYCKSCGVSASTYYSVWKYSSEATAAVDAKGNAISGSKKFKVLSYINSLNLTTKQKDSLYLALGYATSNLYDTPWH
ncbi:MAG: DEAD/DEAH box helicase family protein [Clostridia bacterium]|nr:DEAD/DEAH box helicase family protein [Clostridia bacterium]